MSKFTALAERCYIAMKKVVEKLEILAKFSDDARDRRLFKVQLNFGFTETIAIAIDLKTQLAWKVKLNCIL